MSSNDNDWKPPVEEPVRFSRLKLMGKSPAHYITGNGEETGPMRKGSALHAFLLGQTEKIAVYRDGVRNPKSAKWIEFRAEHAGKHLLIPSEFETADKMRQSVERHDRAMELLAGTRETRITWTLAGRACAGTPDVVQLRADGSKVLVELKTAQSSAPDLFRWQARKLAYHAQVAWYARGLEMALAYKPGPVVEQYIVAVESSAPYPVTVFRVTDALRTAGERQARCWLEQLLVCERTGTWPGYVDCDVDMDEEDRDELEWDDDEAAA